METATAQLNNLRISPRKARLVADYMRGKRADDALASLNFVDKRAAEPLKKLLQSALSNAKNLDMRSDDLFIKEITVNSGETLYRRMPAPRGRAMMIRKKTSRIVLVLGEKTNKKHKTQNLKPETTEAGNSKTETTETKKPKTSRKPKAQQE